MGIFRLLSIPRKLLFRLCFSFAMELDTWRAARKDHQEQVIYKALPKRAAKAVQALDETKLELANANLSPAIDQRVVSEVMLQTMVAIIKQHEDTNKELLKLFRK
jgi:hypothetical protein